MRWEIYDSNNQSQSPDTTVIFKELIQYLDQHEGVILRAIKQEFADVSNIDRSIEEYIKAGYIRRESKN